MKIVNKRSFFGRVHAVVSGKIKRFCYKICAPNRRKKLKTQNFTIISNNCWAGDVYQFFGLKYASPTAGLFFFADEYIKFLSDLRRYLSLPIEQISCEQSKYKDELLRLGYKNKILARIDDVEIVMLHYKTWEDAKLKWERRASRINYENLIIKFSRQNLCKDEHVEAFSRLDYKNKIFFDNNLSQYEFAVYLPGYEKCDYLLDDIKNYRKRIDIYKLINDGEIIRK